jgi:hypothetical protein
MNMYRLLCLLSVFFYFSFLSTAQTNAITEYGEHVILYDNGTWVSENNDNFSSKIEINSTPFFKKWNSSFLMKSKINNSAILMNMDNWEIQETTNDDAEYEFKYKHGDLYCLIINEEVDIPVESLADIAFETMKDSSFNPQIVKKEYRTVNGRKVLHMIIDATASGIDFRYSNYYYSDNSGCTQICTFTSQNLMDKYFNASQDLLNGFDDY